MAVKKVTSFEILDRMCSENQDIRLAPAGNIINLRATKAGTQVTIGVEGNIISALMNGKLTACLLVYDLAQFKETEERLKSALL